jgi:DNA-binding transcriptional LysR family regulator
VRNLDLLATFVAVYRAGSISAAAAELGRSQPSVSERIATLEQTLAVELFERGRRGVTPTSHADALAARVTDAVDALGTVWDAPADATPTGVVRVGTASDVAAARIIPALAPLAGGGLRLEFTLGLAGTLLDLLADGGLDVVVSSVRPSRPSLRYRGLVDEEFVLVGAPAVLARIDPDMMRENPAAALATVPLVAYDAQRSILRRYWRSQFGVRPVAPLALVVPDLRGVLAAVVAGAGISVLPRYLADPAVHAGLVQLVHRGDDPPINTLHLVLPADAPSAATSLVIERLRDSART